MLYRRVPRGGLPIHLFTYVSCRIFRLATNSEKNCLVPKQFETVIRKYRTRADHGYSRQRAQYDRLSQQQLSI